MFATQDSNIVYLHPIQNIVLLYSARRYPRSSPSLTPRNVTRTLLNEPMLRNRKQFLMWRRQVFVRNPHNDLNLLYSGLNRSTGVYLIGCADEVVYVGQSWILLERPFESLGRIYHRVPDTSLPWSLALAPCAAEEMDERESTAIRAYAPKFNTSIPSIPKSEGRMPEAIGAASVFQNQIDSGGAFDPVNLERQMERARGNLAPPWRQGKQRKKTGKREKRPDPKAITEPVALSKEELRILWEHYGVPSNGPLRYKINLCNDGSVITKDGELIGNWTMDEHEFPSFIPNETTTSLLQDVWVGLLCIKILEWHEASTGETVSD